MLMRKVGARRWIARILVTWGIVAVATGFVQNVTQKLLTYSLGRGLERFDRPTVEAITTQVKANNYKFSSLVMEVVKSRPFQMQSVEAARP